MFFISLSIQVSHKKSRIEYSLNVNWLLNPMDNSKDPKVIKLQMFTPLLVQQKTATFSEF